MAIVPLLPGIQVLLQAVLRKAERTEMVLHEVRITTIHLIPLPEIRDTIAVLRQETLDTTEAHHHRKSQDLAVAHRQGPQVLPDRRDRRVFPDRRGRQGHPDRQDRQDHPDRQDHLNRRDHPDLQDQAEKDKEPHY